MNAGPNPYAPPQASALPVVSPQQEAADALAVEVRALKLAGVLLLVGSALNLVAMAEFGSTILRATYSGGWISIGFDLWVGGSLAVGQFRVRSWAMLRAGLGALIGGGAALAQGLVADGIMTLASCAAILLLVAPKPNGIRIKLAAVTYGLTAIVAVIVLIAGKQ